MNFKFFSFLVYFLIISPGINSLFLPFSQHNTQFAQLDTQNFGNALLSAISLQMFADTPVDQILTMLNEVNELLNAEQETEDQEIYQIREDCNEQLELLNKSIEFHKSLKGQLETGQIQYENLIKASEMKEQDIKQRIAIVNNLQDQEKQRNNKTIEEFLIKIQQLNNATNTVIGALSLIDHIKTDSSFIQLQKYVDNISNKLQQIKGTNHQIVPLITVFTVLGQITKNGDQEALDEIIKLLDKIKDNYEREIQKEQEIEDNRQLKYMNYIRQLNQESLSQSNRLEQNQQELQQYKESFEYAQRNLKFHTEQLVKFQQINERVKDFCVTKNEEYEKTTKYRLVTFFFRHQFIELNSSADIHALEQLIPSFKEKAKALKKYLQQRANEEF